MRAIPDAEAVDGGARPHVEPPPLSAGVEWISSRIVDGDDLHCAGLQDGDLAFNGEIHLASAATGACSTRQGRPGSSFLQWTSGRRSTKWIPVF